MKQQLINWAIFTVAVAIGAGIEAILISGSVKWYFVIGFSVGLAFHMAYSKAETEAKDEWNIK